MSNYVVFCELSADRWIVQCMDKRDGTTKELHWYSRHDRNAEAMAEAWADGFRNAMAYAARHLAGKQLMVG